MASSLGHLPTPSRLLQWMGGCTSGCRWWLLESYDLGDVSAPPGLQQGHLALPTGVAFSLLSADVAKHRLWADLRVRTGRYPPGTRGLGAWRRSASHRVPVGPRHWGRATKGVFLPPTAPGPGNFNSGAGLGTPQPGSPPPRWARLNGGLVHAAPAPGPPRARPRLSPRRRRHRRRSEHRVQPWPARPPCSCCCSDSSWRPARPR